MKYPLQHIHRFHIRFSTLIDYGTKGFPPRSISVSGRLPQGSLTNFFGGPGGTRTHTPVRGKRILSPSRLPITPPGHLQFGAKPRTRTALPGLQDRGIAIYACLANLVVPPGFEPGTPSNLEAEPAYKTGVLPLNYRTETLLVVTRRLELLPSALSGRRTTFCAR